MGKQEREKRNSERENRKGKGKEKKKVVSKEEREREKKKIAAVGKLGGKEMTGRIQREVKNVQKKEQKE